MEVCIDFEMCSISFMVCMVFASLLCAYLCFVKHIVSTIACSMRFGGIVDVGRGSHSVGRIYGDLGDSVCEDIAGSIPCALYVLCTWTLLHVSTVLYSTLLDVMITQDYCV